MRLLTSIGLLLGLASSLAVAQNAPLADNAPLTVNVSGFKSSRGMAKYWLWRSADGYPNDEKKAVKIVEAPITGTTSHCVFDHLPAGTYAVAVCHDENGNHKFDTTFLGIPTEAYGNTNGARGGIGGPPKFEKSSFTHAKPGTTVAVKVE